MKPKVYSCKFAILTILTLLFLQTNSFAQTCLQWENLGLANAAPIPNGATYTVGGVTMKANSYLETNGGVTSATYTFNSGLNGNHTGFAALDLDNSSYDQSDRYFVTYTFSRPVVGLSFSVLDVDASGFQDDVEIYYNGGNNIKATPAFYTLGGGTVALDNETYMDGFEGTGNANTNVTTSNINVNFGTTAVTSITVVYFSSEELLGNPGAQQIGISDFCWTSATTANTNCFTWEGLGQANGTSFLTGSFPFNSADGNTVTLSNSFATNGGTIVRALTFNSGVQGAHTGFLDAAMDNDAFDENDIWTINLNFTRPVTGLRFSLLDIDLNAAAGGWQDAVELIVNGVNVRNLPGSYTFGSGTVNVGVDDETYMNGFEGTAGNTASTDDFSNINFDLGSIKVTSLSIRYFSDDDATGNPGNQRMGVSDLCWNGDKDLDGVPDYSDVDDDNDGLTDLAESGGFDPMADADSDGVPNYQDSTPGPGLPAFVDTNADGINDFYDTDLDGKINAFDLDGDNDGIPDIVEAGGVDTNGDGRIDGAFADADGDGLHDTYDASTGGDALNTRDTDGDGIINSKDLDSDNDGIPDVVEAGGIDANNDGILDGFVDTDNDGLANSVDGDANNDGTVENTAGALIITGADINSDGLADSYPRANPDNNGQPNPYDLDSDGDGILDVREAGLPDADGNGVVDGTLGTDGWSDTIDALATLTVPNSDNNGQPNYLDIDSDNDGIRDNIEGQPSGAGFIAASGLDSDNDGIDNAYDNNDAGFGGTANNGIIPVNTDGGAMPDYTDLDSDNDGIPDIVEAGGVDTNGDGRVDTTTDTDGDGLANVYDTDNGGVNIANLDTDGDLVLNYRDLDSDNDGLPDVIEAAGADTNNDGIIDTAGTDTDADGLADSVDGDVGNDGTAENTAAALIITGVDGNNDGRPDTYPRANLDNSTLPNPYDLDADGDGILDVREAGLTDSNNDGVADGTLGADGWSDTVDALGTLTPTNTDGTGRPNYLDIDSDDDGIVDNTEAQSTAGYIAPAAADADGDGIDDNYDNNDAAFAGNANNGISTLSNVDGDVLPDYLDLDSDNDGYPDRIEGHDTDGDNRPDAGSPAFNGIPGGTADIDGDGLLDGYDNNTASTIATNSGLTPNSHPNVDGGTAERDWREGADSDNDGIANTIDGDDDNDGLPDALEDGGVIATADADGDGIPNYLDPTPGAGPAFVDANGDGINDNYDADQDGIINSLDLDSDNDGITDIIEAGGADANGDGRVDSFVDTDNDGIANVYDVNNGGTPLTNIDTDGDGVPNTRDSDSDGDGIPDVLEGGGIDANNDGRLDNATVDSDGDGLANSIDGDANNDGTAENTAAVLVITGPDVNGDGRADSYPRANIDGSALPNMYDLDSDGDGILDAREAGITDSNNDGIADGTTGPDGWSDTVDGLASLVLPNSDGTGRPNYLDIDSDDDGITDNVEGQSTASYLLALGVDSDGDGIDNAYDNNTAGYAGNANNGLAPYNHDGLDLPDYLDTDSDNDGISDRVEAHDYNLNGNPDDDVALTGVDTDGDGLDNKFDLDNTGANVKNQGMSNGGSTTNPPTPGAAGPLQKRNVANPDRDWRNGLFTLPVRLLSFTGQVQQTIATLTWKADNEINFSGYVVERSIDNINFTSIGNVPSQGTGLNTYNFADDLSIVAGHNAYYRLKMVDIDGKFTYSSIIRLGLDNSDKVMMKIMPNPVKSNLVINLTSNKALNAVVKVTTVDGKTGVTKNISVVKGANVILVQEADRLLNGYYIVTINMDGQLLQEKIIIAR